MSKPLAACSALLIALAATALPATAGASDEPYAPGRGFAVIDTEHIHALVPSGEAEALRPFVARAEVIYVAMARDAGYVIRRPLPILMSDDAETHNGFSTVTPFPLVNIVLAPATQESPIFTGSGELERTLTHELTHHLSNDRSFGFRHALEEVFGRIVPDEPLSLLFAYLSTPAHQTMPTFWHEGCAQWAETVYAPAGQVWQGRGKDSLTHMVWRLAAASPEGMPQPPDWRITYQRWPYGTQTYVWGLAYLRYLDGAYRSRATIWQLIEAQEHRWAFAFNGGPEDILGKSHLELISEARAALMQEQILQLARLRSQPTTTTVRLTPPDARVAAPAWTRDGELFAALDERTVDSEYAVVHRDPGGLWAHLQAWRHDSYPTIAYTGYDAHGLGGARSLPDGTIVFGAVPNQDDPYARTRVHILTPAGDDLTLHAHRVQQPDVAHHGDGWRVIALHLLPAAAQEIVVIDVDAHGRNEKMRALATRDIPWSPAFRPQPGAAADGAKPAVADGPREACWVETDPNGSRLVLAPLAAPDQRTVLASVRGRIIHPAWSADGARVFFCADHTGVANAWCVDAAKPGALIPVTNTIGGIIACVPSPDGRELAVIDHDLHGPYLARIANDPAQWPKTVPVIQLAFPAPVGTRWVENVAHGAAPVDADGAPARADAPAPRAADLRRDAGDGRVVADAGPADAALADGGDAPVFALPADRGDPAATTVHPYHGIEEIRPLYWTPTTLAVPEGGFGIIGAAGDTLSTHSLVASIGSGPVDGRFIGFAGYTYSGWKIELGTLAWQSQRLYNRLVTDTTGDVFDYDEIVDTGEARAGWGLSGSERRYQLYVGAGVAEHKPIAAKAREYAHVVLNSLPPLYGQDRYVEVTAAYSDSRFFPTSYTDEDGNILSATYRHSGFGGKKDGDQVAAIGNRVITVWPAQSHQLVIGGMLGWSRGDRFLQGEFTIGGINALTTLPRGYLTVQAAGNYEIGGSAAYRLPPARIFSGWSTSPLVLRQLVLEGFYDAAKVSSDRIDGDGHWYRSAGAELHTNVEIWTVPLDPGLGLAHRFDGPRGEALYFTLIYGW
jgi:hypothetical protein